MWLLKICSANCTTSTAALNDFSNIEPLELTISRHIVNYFYKNETVRTYISDNLNLSVYSNKDGVNKQDQI